VTLLSAAPPGGADVLLKTDNPMASVFSQINVPEGGTNQAFGITVMPVQQITRGFIYATRPGAGKICRADLWVYPPELVNFTTDKAILQGGEKAQGTVTLGTVAPAGGIKVTLDAGGAKDLIAPKDVVVTGGALEANFVIEAKHRTPAIGYSSNMIIAEWEGKTIPVSIEVH
jgi:hypothetical protein